MHSGAVAWQPRIKNVGGTNRRMNEKAAHKGGRMFAQRGGRASAYRCRRSAGCSDSMCMCAEKGRTGPLCAWRAGVGSRTSGVTHWGKERFSIVVKHKGGLGSEGSARSVHETTNVASWPREGPRRKDKQKQRKSTPLGVGLAGKHADQVWRWWAGKRAGRLGARQAGRLSTPGAGRRSRALHSGGQAGRSFTPGGRQALHSPGG